MRFAGRVAWIAACLDEPSTDLGVALLAPEVAGTLRLSACIVLAPARIRRPASERCLDSLTVCLRVEIFAVALCVVKADVLGRLHAVTVRWLIVPTVEIPVVPVRAGYVFIYCVPQVSLVREPVRGIQV